MGMNNTFYFIYILALRPYIACPLKDLAHEMSNKAGENFKDNEKLSLKATILDHHFGHP